MRAILAGLIALAVIGDRSAAASPPVKKASAGALVVDVVSLKSGRTIRGAILQKHADRSLTMAVSARGYRPRIRSCLLNRMRSI